MAVARAVCRHACHFGQRNRRGRLRLRLRRHERHRELDRIARHTLQAAIHTLHNDLQSLPLSAGEEEAVIDQSSTQQLTGGACWVAAIIEFWQAGFGFFAHNFLTVPHLEESGELVPALAIGAMVLGVAVAVSLYRKRDSDPLDLAILRKRFYFDEFYARLIGVTQELLAKISAFIDRWIIDALGVRGASTTTWGFGSVLRLLQVGNIQA